MVYNKLRPAVAADRFGKVSTITEIIINHAEKGEEGSSLNTAAYHVEVSENGTDYKEVLRVEGNTAGLTEDPIPVTLGRYVKLYIDQPTQGGESAARIYEVEVKGLDEAITSPVYVDKVSTAVLEHALSLTEDVSTDGVLESVVEKYNAALANAKDILTRVQEGDATVTQSMVDNAWQELIKAMQYLSFKQGDKTDLEKVIALAATMETNIDAYLDEGKQEFTDALAAARDVYADGDAMQDEVNTAWANLDECVMANMTMQT